MPQNTKTRFAAFTEANVNVASKNAPAKRASSNMSMERRKKQAEEPIYIYRM